MKDKTRCRNCRFAHVGRNNKVIMVSHKYETDKFTFLIIGDDLIAIPIYALECEHEKSW